MYEIAVVGGGPAGFAAAIHARARDKSVLLITNEPTASPLCRAERVDNYPGMPAVSGLDMVGVMRKQAEEMGVEIKQGRVLNIMPMGDTSYLGIGTEMAEARAVILATGVARAAKLPGEAELLGRGVSYCATCDGMLYRGKKVAVAGNVPNLEEEIAFLRSIGCEVIEVPLGGLKLLGEAKLEGVESKGERTECDGAFLLRATVAHADLLPGLELEDGHIKVDRFMRTNLPGIYAAGDCTGEPLQIAKAVGEGQMAAHTAVTEWLNK